MTSLKPVSGMAASKYACMSRRDFLILGGTAVTVVAVVSHGAFAQELVTSSYRRKIIGKVSELEPGVAVPFNYPTDDIENLLMMLGEEAGGGVGAQRNIVAFNTICPHMGGYMGESEFKSQHSVLGPCSLHLSTFDLTKHGMIVSGHSTASLPQIVLQIESNDIIATGVMGLFYGYNRNPSGG